MHIIAYCILPTGVENCVIVMHFASQIVLGSEVVLQCIDNSCRQGNDLIEEEATNYNVNEVPLGFCVTTAIAKRINTS